MQFTRILGAVIPQVFDSMRYGNGITCARGCDQILLTVPETCVDVLEAVEFFRRRFKRLGQHLKLFGIDRDLAARRAAHKSCHDGEC